MAQDLALCRVRVRFPDLDQVTSYWLPIVAPKTQNDKAYWMPDLGEQVVCLMDEHDEAGAVLGAIYSQADATPVQSADKFHVSFKDGAAFEYDRAAHAFTAAFPAGATFTVTANGATVKIDAGGNVNITAAGGINLITALHNDSVDGIINTYNGHTHSDPSEGNTGVPNELMT